MGKTRLLHPWIQTLITDDRLYRVMSVGLVLVSGSRCSLGGYEKSHSPRPSSAVLHVFRPRLSVYHLYRVWAVCSCTRTDQATRKSNVFVRLKESSSNPFSRKFLYCYQYPSTTNPMSQTPTATSTSNYQVIFDSALEAYKKKTKKDIRSHLLLPKLQTCNSPDAVLAVLREQIPVFDQSHGTSSTSDGLTKWLNPTVNVLYAFSESIGAVISPVSIRVFEVYQFKV